MMNKKSLLVIVVFLLCLSVFSFSETPYSFVSITSGGGAVDKTNVLALGQTSLVINENDNGTLVAKSGFASILSSSKLSDIVFHNETEDKVFETQDVEVKVRIKPSSTLVSGNYKLDRVVYKVGNGEDPDFDKIDPVEVQPSSLSQEGNDYVFDKIITFTQGPVNKFRIWVQFKNTDGQIANSWSDSITIKTGGEWGDDVKLESPDPLTGLSTIDPEIKTSKFSIELSSVTVSLYEGNSTSGTKLYEVSASSTEDEYEIFDSTNSCISYLNSDVLGTKLKNNKQYTLCIEFSNSEKYQTITQTFKALSGGVADILTYPSPFNPNKQKVKIRYLLAKDSRVTIKLYDKAGKIVCKLIQSESRSAGTNEEMWDGRSFAGETLATGAYIVEIIAKSSSGEDRRYTALAIVGK